MGAFKAPYIVGLLVSCWFACVPSQVVGATYPAFFIFGDSLVDVGNNNYITTIATADNLPYGIDYPQGPTGRFCNGKVVVDFISDSLSLPYPPPYLASTTRGSAILKGVNYASAAGGILRFTGLNFVGRVDLDTQLSWFNNSMQELTQQLGAASTQQLLAGALYAVIIGANDYVNNYLVAGSAAGATYTPAQFQQRLLTQFTSQLTQLYNMGARNILVSSIGPIGCIPSQLAARSVSGECSSYVDSLAQNYNTGLQSVLSSLNSQLTGSKFIYGDVYQPVFAYRSNPTQYGFKFGANACCGGGRFNGQVLCLPNSTVCPDRPDYVFWDAYHPTESTNKLLASDLEALI